MSLLNNVLFRSLVCSIVFLSLFIGLASLVGQQQIAVFDDHVAHYIQGFHSDSNTAIMKGVTTAGSGLYVVLIIGVIVITLFVIGYRRELFFFVGTIVGSSLLNVVLKLLFQRTRPDMNRIIDAAGYSFPSGHSMSAFTLYGLTIYFLWKHIRHIWLRIAALAIGIGMILMIGISRIYLGVHYPSDVIGGYLMSSVWLFAAIGWYEHYLEPRWRSNKSRAFRKSPA
ncbi:phosphatase PAP2 family protein [Paenibacillus sp. YIM B09110]|uniref:phosphatase PAP2 family protein n=1 Tax=Paenibacillus sp. YIM B09110 TaxID=3126102 RepID=UPI00301DD643